MNLGLYTRTSEDGKCHWSYYTEKLCRACCCANLGLAKAQGFVQAHTDSTRLWNPDAAKGHLLQSMRFPKRQTDEDGVLRQHNLQ